MIRFRQSFHRTIAALGVVLALGGCVVPRAGVDSSASLEVLRADGRFPTPALAGDWVVYGESGTFAPAIRDGVPSVRAVPGDETAVLARRVDATVLATPFLSWAWSMDPSPEGAHPVDIVVGFYGGDPASGSWGSQPLAWTGSPLPPFDRLLALRWGALALRRGTLEDPPEDRQRAYIVRGGNDNAASWWLETVDLSDIYARAWPRDDRGRAKVMFVGIRVRAHAADTPPAAGYVSGIILSR